MYIQWLAYGTSEIYDVSCKWPSEIQELHRYCEDRMVYVQELYIILDHILAYTPQQWTGWQGHYINELKENLHELWRTTLTTPFFIQKEVMLEWYACFSHWNKGKRIAVPSRPGRMEYAHTLSGFPKSRTTLTRKQIQEQQQQEGRRR